MRLTKLCLSLGLALTALVPGATAADFNNGSIKDRGGVPIPAPIPVVETFKWYLRADVGGGLYAGGDLSTSGNLYGFDRDPAEGPAFGVRPAWFSGNFDTFAVGGGGVGMYLTPRLRADVTVDARTPTKLEADGSYVYRGDPAIYGDPTATPPGYLARIHGHAREQVEVRNLMTLANLYFDLAERGSRLVPYIGAGIGMSIRSIDRRHNTIERLYDVTDPTNEQLVNTTRLAGQSKGHVLTPAAAIMAGVGYTIDNGMVLDFNYRFAWSGGFDHTTNVAYSNSIGGIDSGASKIKIGDVQEHAIRAGIRWNIW